MDLLSSSLGATKPEPGSGSVRQGLLLLALAVCGSLLPLSRFAETPLAVHRPPEANEEALLQHLPLAHGKVIVDSRPSPQAIVAAVRATWPEDAEAAQGVLWCESRDGADPDAWKPEREDGGPMQINRATWENYFLTKYGWRWDQIVFDLQINLKAAREVFDISGGWRAWTCFRDDSGQKLD